VWASLVQWSILFTQLTTTLRRISLPFVNLRAVVTSCVVLLPAFLFIPGSAGGFVTDERPTLVFSRWTQGSDDIWVMRLDGTHQRRLTRGPGDDAVPDWSPDGSQIVFERSRGASSRGVYVMNADGSGQRLLVRNGGHPRWSPDGRQIAFDSVRQGAFGIYVMDSSGSRERLLTNRLDGFPAWSPDGRRIAFVSARDGTGEIYVMNANGGGQRRLTHGQPRIGFNPSASAQPAWSPDGHTIAFASDAREDQMEIYVMDSTSGARPRQLTHGHSAQLVEASQRPSWSPDGQMIAFDSNRANHLVDQIYIMNADGSDQRQLTKAPLNLRKYDWGPDSSYPDWSPAA